MPNELNINDIIWDTPDPAKVQWNKLPQEVDIAPLEQDFGPDDLRVIGTSLGEGLRRFGEGAMQLGMGMLGTKEDAKQYTASVEARRQKYIQDYAARNGMTPDQASKFLGFGELVASAVPIGKVANLGTPTTFTGAVARNAAAGALYAGLTFNASGEDADRLTNMGFGALFGGTLGGAAAVFPAVKNWARNTANEALSKYKEVLSPAERSFDAITPGGSIFLTPGQMSGKPSAIKFERLVANDVAARTYVNQLEGIGKTYNALQQQIKRGATPEALQTAQRLRDVMDKHIKGLQDAANKQYDTYATAASTLGEAGNLKLDMPTVLGNLRQLRAQEPSSNVYAQVKTFLGANDAQLAKKLEAVEAQDKIVEGIQQQYRLGPEEYDKALQIAVQRRDLSGDARLTMGELIKLTKGINQLYKLGKPEVTSAANFLKTGLYDDVQRLQGQYGDNQAFKTYKTMLDDYKSRMEYKEAVQKRLLSDSLNVSNNDDAVKLLDRLQAASEGEQKWARETLKELDPELLQDLRSLSIARMVEASQNTMQGFAKGQRVGGGSVVTAPVKPGGYWLFDEKERQILEGGTEKLGRIMNNYDALGAVDIDPQGMARIGGGALTGNQGTLGVFLPGMIGKLAITRKLEKIMFTPEGQQALSKLDPTSTVWGTAGRLAGLEYLRQQVEE